MFNPFYKCSIFISHKRDEGKVTLDAIWFANALKEKNTYSIFLDVREDYIGNFPKVLSEKIKKSNIFLLVLPSNRDFKYLCDKNNWVHKEILYALKKIEYDENSIKILPVSFKENVTFPPKEDLGEIAAISDYSILYCDINNQEYSKQKLYKAIGYKPWKFYSFWTTFIFILFLFIGLFLNKEYFSKTQFNEEDAVALYKLANEQSANKKYEESKSNYKKVKDYWASQKNYTVDYFISYFMYLEYSFEFIDGNSLIKEYQNIVKEIEQNVNFKYLKNSEIMIYNQIIKKSTFKIGYNYYYKLHNLDSAWHYMQKIENYFIETNDSLKTKDIDKIKRKWIIKHNQIPQNVQTTKSESNNQLSIKQHQCNPKIKSQEVAKQKEYHDINDLFKNENIVELGQ